MQTDVGSNVGFDLSDSTTNTRGPIACLLAISEEIDIVEIAKFLEKWRFAGDVSICLRFKPTRVLNNTGAGPSTYTRMQSMGS